MNPYSVDLRQRAVSAYERGEGSMPQIAERYEVCEATLRDWCRRHRADSLAPLPHSGGDRSILTDEDRDHIVKTALARNDATLTELGDDLAAQRGVRVTEKTIGVVLKERKITRKKRLATQPSAKRRNGKPSEKHTNKK
jgi:transposase